MKRKSSLIILSLSMAMFLASCGGGTQYKDASKDKGSREWGPREIKTTVGTMVNSMAGYLKNEWKQSALLQVQKIRNKTTEHIDTQMFADELTTNLMKRRIMFVDPSYTKEALQEIEKGMTGVVDPDSAIPVGQLKSPNFYLFGEINDNVRNVGGKRLQYLVVTLKLKNIATGMLVWQEQQEFLKSSKTDKISF